MKRHIFKILLVLSCALLFLFPAPAMAQVNRIELDIMGYLCGF